MRSNNQRFIGNKAYIWCLVRLYLQMFVEGLKSYLRYLCLLTYSGIQHILCCVFCFVCLVSCVPNVCKFLWIVNFLIASSVFSNAYFLVSTHLLQTWEVKQSRVVGNKDYIFIYKQFSYF